MSTTQGTQSALVGPTLPCSSPAVRCARVEQVIKLMPDSAMSGIVTMTVMLVRVVLAGAPCSKVAASILCAEAATLLGLCVYLQGHV